jgi:hypothetical protein
LTWNGKFGWRDDNCNYYINDLFLVLCAELHVFIMT